jgi:uncharacterized membrane protein
MADSNAAGGTSGLSDSAAGAIAYFTFIPAVFFLVSEPYNKSSFVRFHAWPSILLFFAAFGVSIALGFLLIFVVLFSPFPHLTAWRLIDLFWMAVWLVCVVSAAQGKRFKLPVIGNLAEQQANK